MLRYVPRDRFADSGGVVFRTPLLPYATWERLVEGGTARAAWLAGGDVAAAVDAELDTLDERLATLVADTAVREAIAHASPSLDDAIGRWLGDRSGDARRSGAVRRAMLAYIARMAGRATPFGLLATSSAGTVAGAPAYRLAEDVCRHERAGVRAIGEAVARLLADAEQRECMTFVANPSIYRAGGRLRFTEVDDDGGGVHYHPVAVEEDEALDAVLARAATGATLAELAGVLAPAPVAEARAYLDELVAIQLLVPDAGPVLTGDDPAARLPVAVPATGHIDAVRATDALVLGNAVANAAHDAVAVLHRITHPPAEDDLTRFRDAFTERYGEREVGLGEALDDEAGIGFGAPLALSVQGAPLLRGVNPVVPPDGPSWTPVDHHRIDLMSRALRTGAIEVEIDEAELVPLTNRRPLPLLDAVAVRATVVAASAEAVAAGDFDLLVHDVSGPEGAALFSRLASAEPDVDALVRRHVADEERLRPDVVLAEVVHLPAAAADVVVRPVLHAYEIPLDAHSGVPADRQITLADLRVRVVGGRVVLRSERLDREVLPRLTVPHDPQLSALPVYRFLGALRRQGCAATLAWSWGAVASAPFLPRVRVGRLVLARAQWRVYQRELRGVLRARSAAERFAAVQRLREEHGLPRVVTVTYAGSELPVDLESVPGALLVAHEAHVAEQLTLRELYPAPDRLCVEAPGGRLAHEFVLPLVRLTPSPATFAAPTPVAVQDTTDWLVARLYCGIATSDRVLRDVVAPLVAGAAEWSFLRRTDRDPHLRLVLRGDPDELSARLRRLADPRVWRVTTESYQPDGTESLAPACHADSVAVLTAVAHDPSDLDARWRFALAGLDRLLADAGLDLPERRDTVRRWRDAASEPLLSTGPLARRRAGNLFRRERDRLDLSGGRYAGVLEQRSAFLRPLLADASPDAVRTLVRRHVNRTLRAAHDVQEVLLFDLLDRCYSARLERAE